LGLQVLLKSRGRAAISPHGRYDPDSFDCALHQRRRVQYQGDLAVAEDGRAADPGKPLDSRRAA